MTIDKKTLADLDDVLDRLERDISRTIGESDAPADVRTFEVTGADGEVVPDGIQLDPRDPPVFGWYAEWPSRPGFWDGPFETEAEAVEAVGRAGFAGHREIDYKDNKIKKTHPRWWKRWLKEKRVDEDSEDGLFWFDEKNLSAFIRALQTPTRWSELVEPRPKEWENYTDEPDLIIRKNGKNKKAEALFSGLSYNALEEMRLIGAYPELLSKDARPLICYVIRLYLFEGYDIETGQQVPWERDTYADENLDDSISLQPLLVAIRPFLEQGKEDLGQLRSLLKDRKTSKVKAAADRVKATISTAIKGLSDEELVGLAVGLAAKIAAPASQYQQEHDPYILWAERWISGMDRSPESALKHANKYGRGNFVDTMKNAAYAAWALKKRPADAKKKAIQAIEAAIQHSQGGYGTNEFDADVLRRIITDVRAGGRAKVAENKAAALSVPLIFTGPTMFNKRGEKVAADRDAYRTWVKAIGYALGLTNSIWCIDSVLDFTEVPFPEVTKLFFDVHFEDNTTIDIKKGSTWADLWVAADKAISTVMKGDHDHRWIETFKPGRIGPRPDWRDRKPDTRPIDPTTIELGCGS